MGSRTQGEGKDRCPECRIWRLLCYCSELPTLHLQTRIKVVMHYREWEMTTNTARLARQILPDCEIRLRGAPWMPAPSSTWGEATDRCAVLFPSDDSVELKSREDFDRLLPGAGRRVLIVPDGTWSQASRLYRRTEGLADFPRVRLAAGGPSRYRLRTGAHPHQVSTFEAIARALGILEGPEVQRTLEQAFELFVERRLMSKGKLPLPESVRAQVSLESALEPDFEEEG